MNETNLYAKQNHDGRSPSNNRVDTTIQEMKAFIGCLILMGIHHLPALCNFWSSDPLLTVDAIADVMMSKRFKKLLENIHCNNNETKKPRDHAEYDKLHKLRPFIEKVLQNCKDNYEPSSFPSVDESMIPFEGRSSMKQYMPMKPVKRGYKLWCLLDSNNGYVIKFDIYTGKCKTNGDFTLGERVVAELMKEICKENTLVAFDMFFTTVKLMSELLKMGVYACGTVKTSRKGLPKMMKENNKLARGEFQFETKGVIFAVKWLDNRPVTFLSSFHDPKETTVVKRENKDGTNTGIFCPEVVAECNKMMGVVDRFNQLRERYALGRRSVKWWHRIFHFLVDVAIVNSFVLWKVKKEKMDSMTSSLTEFV